MKKENPRRFSVRRFAASLLACVVTVGTVAGLSPSAFAAGYDDVSSSDWFSSAVEYVTDHNYMGASADNKFQPAVPMTRAGFVEVLYRMVGSPAVTSATSFSDVPSYHTNAKAISWAVSTGMTNGTGNNRFTPYGTLTRETIAAFMDRYIAQFGDGKFSYVTYYKGYTDDGRISSWAKPSVITTTRYGIFQGDDNGRFNPQKDISRAKCATIVMRVDQKLNAGSQTPAPTPIPTPTPAPSPTPTSIAETDKQNADKAADSLLAYLRSQKVANLPSRDADLDRVAQAALTSSASVEELFSQLGINKP